ncbi:TfpX/TfpZ family type IV pilin accessory protein [Acidovorax sp. LjRoot117]|uniref:TfpX/TfpZ family type IV pilin accessory protein n=1 Tax=Acidovorax sp. LjRoot117 TaxID=3342255 RepID=UPI003ECC47BE
MWNLKERLLASGIHLSISICIVGFAALLVFGLWYPYPYWEVSGGRTLFLLMACVDVAIGPLITLIVFNRAKPRRELVLDFTVVGLLQIAALSYGMWAVFVARPVHLVFEYSRMTVVHAIDIDDTLLTKAPVSLRRLPITGPTTISLRPFRDATEQFDLTMAAIEGIPLSARSDLWQSFDDSIVDILKEAKPVEDLRVRFIKQVALIDKSIKKTGLPASQLRYLPLVGRNNAWTILLDASTAKPLGFLPLDSF